MCRLARKAWSDVGLGQGMPRGNISTTCHVVTCDPPLARRVSILAFQTMGLRLTRVVGWYKLVLGRDSS
jgi:hypothetical protein